MGNKQRVTIDGNTAAAHIAYAFSEVAAIYPITPSSPMGELADSWTSTGRRNLWGKSVEIMEMQSEAGAAGAVHGSLVAGALTTTFTASQGLLLMIPNMHKIAGEMIPTVFHVSARSLAAQSLSIFGDHSDVMSCRNTGFAITAANNVQETMDLALVAHLTTLEAQVPFLAFFDGFRTSHELSKVEDITYDEIRGLVDEQYIRRFRERAMRPEKPMLHVAAQNEDVYFQGRETVNPYYDALPEMVQKYMDKVAALTGRPYHLFDYVGAPDATDLVIVMGSGADTFEWVSDYRNEHGGKTGVLKVRLYRPFSAKHFVDAIPASVKRIAVMDRTKEPGSLGEPLYQDVVTALSQMGRTGMTVIGGRYGLSSKDFTPAHANAVYDHLAGKAFSNFTVGINDDVTGRSIPINEKINVVPKDVVSCMFWGLGSDGTVGANKNSIKIIGEATDNKAQAYFVYDSKKSGSITTSHLRFGKHAIRKPYLVTQADFVACHKFTFLEKYDMLANAKKGGTFLLTSPYGKDDVWNHLPVEVQKQIIDKDLKFYVIDAVSIAEKAGMGGRINVVMQTAFFKISGILPEAEAVSLIKKFIEKSYGKKGADVVKKNIDTIDMALTGVEKVDYPKTASSSLKMLPAMTADAPDFIKNILGTIAVNKGDDVKVSEFPEDGTFPSASTQYEKRAIAERMPIWEPDLCIQCGQCTMVCPHAVIRAKAFDPAELKNAPASFKSADYKTKEFPGWKFTIQASAEDCTGCGLCVQQCPAKSKDNPEIKAINMKNFAEHREEESANWKFFFDLPDPEADKLNLSNAKFIAMKRPLFEFSGACAGCGETPYVKLLSQLYGDRAVIANATGCSSIYGGNLPSTPYAKNAAGLGPAWSNSLFEDAAEFGYGMRLTSDKLAVYAREVAATVKAKGIAAGVIDRLLANEQADDMAIETQRKDIEVLKKELASSNDEQAKELASLADHFVKRSVWVIGGDGWAYDIGYGGLDHVLASGRNINVLVLDTEVYSNTGGQMSKATPIGAVAKFAAGGKDTSKKDLGMMAMSYGYVYVAKISMGANMNQVIKAFREAESYDGPSLIIAYSHCINHGINMEKGMTNQKEAVTTGLWPLYRFDPRLADEGKNPFQLDSKEPDYNIADFMYKEVRFKTLKAADPARAEMLLKKAEAKVKRQWQEYKYLADRPF